MSTLKKRKIAFIDAEKQRCKVTAEINDRNWKPSFSMTWEVSWSLGQCNYEIKPRTDAQRKLLEIWNRWHLNYLHAGTKEQEEALKNADHKIEWYDNECEYLKSKWLLIVKHPETWEDYKYWTARLTEELPVDLWQKVEDLMDTIAEEEANEDEIVTKDTKFTEEELKEMSYDDEDKAIALAILYSVRKKDLLDWSAITNDRGNYWTIYWTEYLFGTDDEMDREWDEALESYIDDCILPWLNGYWQYFDNESWKDDVKMDWRWNTLNRYDGSEDDITYGWIIYYSYQQ